MRDARLLQAFFATLEGDGIRVGVEEHARMRVLFSTRHQWDLATLRVALRSLLIHDPHHRASFDRHFKSFFAGENDVQLTIPADQLHAVLDALRNLKPSDPIGKQRRPQPVAGAGKLQRHSWRERARRVCGSPLFLGACGLGIFLGLFVWLSPRVSDPEPEPELSTPTAALPVFAPASLSFESREDGGQSKKVVLSNPDHEAVYIIESLTGLAEKGSEGLELKLSPQPAAFPYRLAPGENFEFVVRVEASPSELWNGRVEAVIQGIDVPVLLRVLCEDTWTTDPWRDLATRDRVLVSTHPLPVDFGWVVWFITLSLSLAGGVGFYVWLYRRRKLDLTPIDVPELDAPGKGFSVAAIGGSRKPVIRPKRIRRLADMLGQVFTDELTRRLDLARTIEQTIRAGGVPEFAWQLGKVTRRVLILEDALIDPDRLTSVMDDLQQGLERTGVEVDRVWFRHGVNRFANARGVTRELRELHALRHHYVVFVHTDGSGFARHPARQTLTSLADWPAVAVLDPRNPQSWGQAADSLADLPLPRFRADDDGVNRAFQSWVRQRLAPVTGNRPAIRQARRGQPVFLRDPEREVEATLGDSLLWAADCVWVQPCSRALAEALRDEFHSELPADRLQRILELPDTRSDQDGFRFGKRTRNALRAIWKRRQTEERRARVRDFIAEQLDEAEPGKTRSMAHLVWEAHRERFRLEADPHHSPRRLAELARTEVNPFVRESLHDFRFGSGPAGDDRTVLETKCEDPKSRQYLASVSDNLAIPFHEQLPLEGWHRACLGGLATLAAVCLLGLWTGLGSRHEYWEIAQQSNAQWELYEIPAGGEPMKLGVWGEDWIETDPVPSDGNRYRVLQRSQQGEQETSFNYSSGESVSISTLTTTLPSGQAPAWKKFVSIPAGEFEMGSPTTEVGRFDNEQQHTVALTRSFRLAATEVTQRQYRDVMRDNPSRFKENGLDLPVENVSWDDARQFCEVLTKREREAGRLPVGWEYRLPTEAQWEYACRARTDRARTDTPFAVGDGRNLSSSYANFDGNYPYGTGEKGPYLKRTEEVGKYPPNEWKLHDMHGNVWEWCRDWFDTYPEAELVRDPTGPGSGQGRVVRGGSWFDRAWYCRSAFRYWYSPEFRDDDLGFRVAAVRVGASPRDEGELAIEIEKFGDLEFVKVPAGELNMGSPDSEDFRDNDERQHRVKISRPFYLGCYEVTQQQWEQVMGTSLQEQSKKAKSAVFGGIVGEGPNHPMYHVNWIEANEFCAKLTEQHRKDGVLPSGYVYALPTEAQWEYACRARTDTPFAVGDGRNLSSSYANFDGNYPYGTGEKGPYLARTEEVGKYPPNAWKLHDMHGNVWEWCWDRFDEYPEAKLAPDPRGPCTGQERVMRGGSWDDLARVCRSAYRDGNSPGIRVINLGFRVAAVREIELEERKGR